MGIIAIEDLPARLEGGRTLAGLDLGDKTIGVAVSDRGLSFAHPRPVILRKKFSLDAAALLAQLQKDNIGAFVLGLPINMDGSEGPRAQKSRAFVRNMAGMTDLPFVLWDERLSTVAAERTLIEMDFSRRKRAGKIDSAAAAFILQGVLDRLQSLGSSDRPEPDSPPFA
ncbi:Holliday junction resolvase RuvX [Mesorhizobium neociceri]|uniref:Putative pre-16S rRNA nuclease n=1 Tax=Mesorhizobium neociceri TaxID=1307853 RepID=A0A838B364_9HYPH|nr:Holliday junction resolvase RuvX [Mesorhizobium neociceri]MBA1140402.1 Holliday junction resolvase RuvX [Mesorhizobium neociceri]